MSPKSDQEDSNAPEITFEKLIYDYGNIKQNEDGICEFVFKNTGNEPLILSNARSTCGFTVPSWPNEPILPGHTNKIKVQYNTSRIGPINKSITVSSNAKNSIVVLFIKGNVGTVNEENKRERNTEK
ncbi:MAG: DUF1573 domain-containing protein [Bacteroidota bacterium]|nr:DUF1573 domain-containing protein [Bacteroidota bacterium]